MNAKGAKSTRQMTRLKMITSHSNSPSTAITIGYRTAEPTVETRDEAGFTLIELLIVIVVLGILAAVVVFGLSAITNQSAQTACNADAKSVELAVEAYRTAHGTWPTAIDLTTPDPTNNNIRYLRAFPANPNHYLIKIDTNGKVTVEPHDGNGGVISVANSDFDASPNPCSAAM